MLASPLEHFIDETAVFVKAGDGGNGMMSFKRARNHPKLGPDGGNGGNGGHVIIKGDANLNTLSHLRYRQQYKAQDGGKGGNNNCKGRCGEPFYIPVPLGSVILRADTSEKVGEITEAQQEIIVALGGVRGMGNLAFTNSTRRAPDFKTEGKKGESFELKLELKLLADVGLAGFPNAGKSTLLSSVSEARPKIADYPFTTLTPQLGVVNLHPITQDYRSFVMADIPGLIEGASQGRGLGDRFLRHLERTKVIAFVLDAFTSSDLDLWESFEVLRKELYSHNPETAEKKVIVIFNKADLLGDEENVSFLKQKQIFDEKGYKSFLVSAASRQGLKEVLLYLAELISSSKEEVSAENSATDFSQS
ncbi:MAG: GTPase ObgE [Oligoflexales bacterium]|nr:GTPase ObgE [Oligoflexales bacterium]